MSMIHHGMSGHPSDEYFGCALCTKPIIIDLVAERDRLKQFIEAMDKDSKALFERANRYREALEKISRCDCETLCNNYEGDQTCYEIAKSALSGAKGKAE